MSEPNRTEYDVTITFRVSNVGSMEEAIASVQRLISGQGDVSATYQPVAAKDVTTVRNRSLEETMAVSRLERIDRHQGYQ